MNSAEPAPGRPTTASSRSARPVVAAALAHISRARERADADRSAKIAARTDASLAAISIPRGVGLSPGGGRTATHAPQAAPDCASGAGRCPDDHGKAETAHPGGECETHPSRTTWGTTSHAAVDPPEYQNAANPRFEASLDARALAYALEHTNFFGGFMAPQGAKSARQGTQGCACAPRTGSAFRCETSQLPQGSGNDLVLRTPFPARRSPREEFEPSRRLSETTGQRSVSAFRVAFQSAEVTRRQVRGKRPGRLFAPRAPGLPDRP